MTAKRNGGSDISTPAEPQTNLRPGIAPEAEPTMEDVRLLVPDPTRPGKQIEVFGTELFEDPSLPPEDDPKPKLKEPDSELAREFQRINGKYFLLNLSGQVWVGSLEYEAESGGKRLYHYKKTDFKDWEQTYVIDEDGGNNKIHVASRWLESGGKRQYKGVGLYSPDSVPPGHLNLWEGLAIEPKDGLFPKIEKFFQTVLCADLGNGDPSPVDHYHRANTYAGLINLLAYWVQNPTKPGLCALLLTGGKGTGKGTFAEIIRTIFGKTHSRQLSDIDALIGKHTYHLANACFVFADEMIPPYGGAKEQTAVSALNRMITEKTLWVEPKYINAYEVPNHLKLVIASNHFNPVSVSQDERRYLSLRTSPLALTAREKEKYFEELRAAFDEEIPALLHYLLRVKVNMTLIRHPMRTAVLQEQIDESMDPWVTTFRDIATNKNPKYLWTSHGNVTLTDLEAWEAVECTSARDQTNGRRAKRNEALRQAGWKSKPIKRQGKTVRGWMYTPPKEETTT